MAAHNDLGFKGEQIAKLFLTDLGYKILDQNWVFGKAELDMVAFFQKQLIFVEVKTRSSTAFGLPEDFVSLHKQQQMDLAANEYIELMKHEGEVRFDVVSILFDKQNNYTIKHIEDAFWPS